MFSNEQISLAQEVLLFAKSHNFKIAVAESCTGGLIGACLTAIPGSSAGFECGFVTYSNTAKNAFLGVSDELLKTHGAVCTEVAQAMARGAQRCAGVHAAVASTGIAGPDGGSPQRPVGLVHLAAVCGENLVHKFFVFKGNRDDVRSATVTEALKLLQSAMTSE